MRLGIDSATQSPQKWKVDRASRSRGVEPSIRGRAFVFLCPNGLFSRQYAKHFLTYGVQLFE
jgi:hypothetical protein